MQKLNLHIFRARPKKHVAAFPAAYCVDYIASEDSVRKYGDRVNSLIYCFTEEDIIATINSNSDYERIGNLLIDKYFSKPDYLGNLIDWSEKNKNLLVNFINNNLGGGIIEKLNNEDIAKRYVEYCELYRAYHFENTPSWWIGSDFLLERVKDFLQKSKIDSVDSIAVQLTDATEYKTENFEEELSILEIARSLQENKVKKIDDQTLESYPKVKLDFEKHLYNFSSIPFGYNTGVIWGKEYFFNKINIILSTQDARIVIEEKFKKIEDKKESQKLLIAKLSLPENIIQYFKYLRQLSYLQELKKTTQTRSHPVLQMVVKKEIAKRLNIPAEYVDYMSHLEIGKCLLDNRIFSELFVHVGERLKSSVFIMRELKYEWLIGPDAKTFLKTHGLTESFDDNIQELKGAIASRGLAEGLVKVCRFSTEIEKIQDGDVLVTAMTTPDFVPAMKKASAIITDEGGITCHAAIVSRELGKPCIVGTKVATKVLKDGDMVEVDANNGIIKILERAK